MERKSTCEVRARVEKEKKVKCVFGVEKEIKMESFTVRKLKGRIDELELERDIEKRKREVEKLEAKKEINMLKEEVRKWKDLCEEYKERACRVKSEIRRVEKRKRSEERENEGMKNKDEGRKIVLKRGWKGKDLDIEEWWKENFSEIKYRSMVKKAEGIYVFWLEKDEDKKRMLEEKERNNRWHQFYIENWLCTSEWIRKVRERGEGWRSENETQREREGRKQKMD